MKNLFEIDESFVCSEMKTTYQSTLENPDNPTPEDLIKIIKGTHQWTTTSSGDHPEYAKLRNELEAKGFITTSRNSWNGDHVLKAFTLNRVKFNPPETFYSGAAMGWTLKSKRKEL
jgi:hypothetical protein